jgi:Protein of unknown function (DUF1403)
MESNVPPMQSPPKKQRKRGGALATPDMSVLQPLPRWVTVRTGSKASAANDPLPAALAEGAALLALDQIVRTDAAWLGMLRMRLALRAGVVTGRLMRLNADEAELRDAVHLTRGGDDPGPAGRLHHLWRLFASRPTSLAAGTVDALAAVVGSGDAGREVVALMRADHDLAAALGWPVPMALAATVILDPALRRSEDGKRCRAGEAGWLEHRHAVSGLAAVQAHAEAVVLQRRAGVLAAAVDRLRTHKAAHGIAMILADDAVAPWRMVGPRGMGSDRAARRFCETLAGVGALRLLTERPTFRLYGL